jgi:hypothetical protein
LLIEQIKEDQEILDKSDNDDDNRGNYLSAADKLKKNALPQMAAVSEEQVKKAA